MKSDAPVVVEDFNYSVVINDQEPLASIPVRDAVVVVVIVEVDMIIELGFESFEAPEAVFLLWQGRSGRLIDVFEKLFS